MTPVTGPRTKTFHFRPQRTHYCPANAYWAATLSKCAYAANGTGNQQGIVEALNALDEQQGFEEVVAFDKNSSQAILARHTQCAFAAFRGTDELADWLDNLKVAPVDGPLGAVHGGFWAALKDIWPHMRTTLANWRRVRIKGGKQPLPLWLTGHSLGGAMATLAAATLVQAEVPFYGVYTFGQPRCGHGTFARNFNNEAKGRHFRFHNNNDIVTRVPATLLGYRHVGTFIYIDSNGNLDADIGWWLRILDAAKGAMDDLGEWGLDSIKDHKVDDYLTAIEKWGDKRPDDMI